MGVDSASRSLGSAGDQKRTSSRTPAASIVLMVWVGVTRISVTVIGERLLLPR